MNRVQRKRNSSPAQIAWRKKFAAMSRAGKLKRTNGKRRKNVTRLSAADIAKLSPSARAQISGSAAPAPVRRKTVKRKSTRKAPTAAQYRGYRRSRAVGRGVKRVYKGARTAVAGLWRGLRNPAARFGVFVWRGDGHYRRSQAVALYVNESAAKRKADTLNRKGGNYVVRTLAYVHDNPRKKRKNGIALAERKRRNGIALAERRRTNTRRKNTRRSVTIIKRAKRVVIKNRGKRRNPKRAFNMFRGRPARSAYKVVTSNRTPSTGLKEAGRLVELRLRGGRLIRGRGKSKVLYKGNRLYFGGLRFKTPNPPGEIDYGEVLTIAYSADKQHLEGDDKTRVYEHRFGEEGGARPHLVIDSEGFPFLDGGGYRVTADGIVD